MWSQAQKNYQRVVGFFRVILSHDNLFNFYKTNFLLMHKYSFTITELENMTPFERDVYISLLENYLKEKQNKANNNV